MSKEEISITASTEFGAKYDEAAKECMHHPKLIAPILKAIVPEYIIILVKRWLNL